MTKTSAERSRIMAAVKAQDTSPEMTVRRLLHKRGYRYRLHGKNLPGKPDLVFPARRKAIFVHGCFWHGHDCKRGDRQPQTNIDYWRIKIAGNRDRDGRNLAALEQKGWAAFTIWECEIKDQPMTIARLETFLKEDHAALPRDGAHVPDNN